MEESLGAHVETTEQAQSFLAETGIDIDVTETIKELEEEMLVAANNLEFEKAALVRDQIRELKRGLDVSQPGEPGSVSEPVSYRHGRKSTKQRRRQVPI